MNRPTKAVFPVAGLGTRFLPVTKASPKEMLPIVDKPLIQYAVEEAAEAGITEMIFITGRTKRAIEDHFDKAYELEVELEARGRMQTLEELRSMLPRGMNCIYMRQSEALGLGHAVLCARPVVGPEPFAVILADDFIDGRPGAMAQMMEMYRQHRSSILGVEDVAPSETASYGIVDAADIAPRLLQVNGIVEKPQPEDAPSNLAVVGRYLFTPRIFEHLENLQPGKGGEIQLTDGIASLMREERVLAYRFQGKRYDCGSKLGYMKANVELAMRHPVIGQEFTAYLGQFAAKGQP
ncbi:MAG: UTP--glucose-1-phosphate uridylyltransferase GalU [Methylophilaceae bacterium]|jgi:UTP--glucose-1-phosphate uridylyltransferase|uniref:UTP--glucose-1-phosphate uridylyltransferase GalU n=1 Tax=Methylobacillus sp. MM3 TaxID=1848039 RepID=UPI0007DF34A8|nr:UTP--glucose-1-phosphate uridylyltransferase GalU [Methylobacillus sp. MM3]OAJ71208.1 UTP--glucose-1-phosphate uridylyltransferase [Methylobacillus sp. MM3]